MTDFIETTGQAKIFAGKTFGKVRSDFTYTAHPTETHAATSRSMKSHKEKRCCKVTA